MSGVFGKVFGKSKVQSQATALASLDKLNEMIMLEAAKATTETVDALRTGASAMKAMHKSTYVTLYKPLSLNMIMLEAAKATTETVDALRTGASAMKAMHKSTNIDDVDKTMDEINDNMENMRQIQDLLSTPMGAAADFDEDELEAELADLEGEELEAELLAPTTTAPTTAPVRVPTAPQSTRPSAQSSKTEDDELAALQAEMAM
ncbi:hypothetical protein PR202_gb27865 [Eleusine coracana subsp. coracana]|uniref:Uncharacterized protein n=1 Tax=Eleusine coracana subsp. coracana TaxID=191504 RepID=A0AAV5FX80_ELECO|nr:hypothetical protein PR202_gb27865 [Eleusine coracana subsp. coracana]